MNLTYPFGNLMDAGRDFSPRIGGGFPIDKVWVEAQVLVGGFSLDEGDERTTQNHILFTLSSHLIVGTEKMPFLVQWDIQQKTTHISFSSPSLGAVFHLTYLLHSSLSREKTFTSRYGTGVFPSFLFFFVLVQSWFFSLHPFHIFLKYFIICYEQEGLDDGVVCIEFALFYAIHLEESVSLEMCDFYLDFTLVDVLGFSSYIIVLCVGWKNTLCPLIRKDSPTLCFVDELLIYTQV